MSKSFSKGNLSCTELYSTARKWEGNENDFSKKKKYASNSIKVSNKGAFSLKKHYVVFRISWAIIFLLWRKEVGPENREDTNLSLKK